MTSDFTSVLRLVRESIKGRLPWDGVRHPRLAALYADFTRAVASGEMTAEPSELPDTDEHIAWLKLAAEHGAAIPRRPVPRARGDVWPLPSAAEKAGDSGELKSIYHANIRYFSLAEKAAVLKRLIAAGVDGPWREELEAMLPELSSELRRGAEAAYKAGDARTLARFAEALADPDIVRIAPDAAGAAAGYADKLEIAELELLGGVLVGAMERAADDGNMATLNDLLECWCAEIERSRLKDRLKLPFDRMEKVSRRYNQEAGEFIRRRRAEKMLAELSELLKSASPDPGEVGRLARAVAAGGGGLPPEIGERCAEIASAAAARRRKIRRAAAAAALAAALMVIVFLLTVPTVRRRSAIASGLRRISELQDRGRLDEADEIIERLRSWAPEAVEASEFRRLVSRSGELREAEASRVAARHEAEERFARCREAGFTDMDEASSALHALEAAAGTGGDYETCRICREELERAVQASRRAEREEIAGLLDNVGQEISALAADASARSELRARLRVRIAELTERRALAKDPLAAAEIARTVERLNRLEETLDAEEADLAAERVKMLKLAGPFASPAEFKAAVDAYDGSAAAEVEKLLAAWPAAERIGILENFDAAAGNYEALKDHISSAGEAGGFWRPFVSALDAMIALDEAERGEIASLAAFDSAEARRRSLRFAGEGDRVWELFLPADADPVINNGVSECYIKTDIVNSAGMRETVVIRGAGETGDDWWFFRYDGRDNENFSEGVRLHDLKLAALPTVYMAPALLRLRAVFKEPDPARVRSRVAGWLADLGDDACNPALIGEFMTAFEPKLIRHLPPDFQAAYSRGASEFKMWLRGDGGRFPELSPEEFAAGIAAFRLVPWREAASALGEIADNSDRDGEMRGLRSALSMRLKLAGATVPAPGGGFRDVFFAAVPDGAKMLRVRFGEHGDAGCAAIGRFHGGTFIASTEAVPADGSCFYYSATGPGAVSEEAVGIIFGGLSGVIEHDNKK